MSLTITLLGTGGTAPTAERGLPAIAVTRLGRRMLFDCGEGTQRQMAIFGVPFWIDEIFLTHVHADHVLGLPGLLRTLGMYDRTQPLPLYGPPGFAADVAPLVPPGPIGYAVELRELAPGAAVRRDGFEVRAFAVDHADMPAVGYALVEDDRPGRFSAEAAQALGVPSGPLRGRLQRGLAVTLPDGRAVEPSLVVGAARPGRRVVISGDARPGDPTVEAARGADVLIHEASFGDAELDRARATGHCTAREAADVAARAGARALVLSHISPRHSASPGAILAEARERFPAALVARDGMRLEVPFAEEGGVVVVGGEEGRALTAGS